MKIASAMSDITEWADAGGVGKYIVMRDHKGGVAAGVEEVVKMYEIKDDVIIKAIDAVVQYFGALRINVICNVRTGKADRVELFRIRG